MPRLAPIATGISMCFAISAHAATIAVTSGSLVESPSNCTILDAVKSINQASLVTGTACAVTTGPFGDNDTALLGSNTFDFQNGLGGKYAGVALVVSKPMTMVGAMDGNGRPLATIRRDPNAAHFGLIATEASLTLQGVTITGGISDASASGGAGGGILAVSPNTNNPITLALVNSAVTGNSAVGNASKASVGGGIAAYDATVLVENTTIGAAGAGNVADIGGGIYAKGAPVYVTASSINSNLTTKSHDGSGYGYGGGIYSTIGAVLTNSTISGNYAYNGGGGVDAPIVNTNFCTLSGNTTRSGRPGGGVLLTGNTGSTSKYAQSIATLMTGNSPGNGVDAKNAGTRFGGDYNSIEHIGGNITIAGNAHSKLMALACGAPSALGNNGGPTQTMALVPATNGCAIDAGPISTDGLSSDQRGALFERRAGRATDIGAFEYQPANDRIFYDGFELP
ncbi:MAG: hypothetical protein JSR27_00585 [Proteobacteria bacterium]|nr:hypothetical protein [Pseudomonadota bacterium]